MLNKWLEYESGEIWDLEKYYLTSLEGNIGYWLETKNPAGKYVFVT